ncbi:SDR family oxidoreductase [Falsiroseomonas sp.]|uniref:SDR family oxidoreductase n=1 Tax=Falsiroseomonas sp. TaxID=2870721 RepID=UPI0027288018|nr:SDR family oxidoreductase [Falsiroseomonas sp.]MDO9502227.1 SDR family oxidoreductase [Falsiroseomonas sp.]
MTIRLKKLADQVIVITGATSGIGLTTACKAAQRGAAVVLAARNADALAEICAGIQAGGGRCATVVADVGVKEDVDRIAEVARQEFGGFDTWVNNAGIGVYATLEEMSPEDHERIFQTNYWGVVHGSLVALKELKRRGGALINIGSISSDMPSPLLGAYTATKHAVKGFTDSLRMEMLHEDAPVAITLIQPSGIDTPFGEHAKNYMDEASQVPPPVYAPEVVASAVLHAAEHPTRNRIVGGWGRGMVAAARTVPSLTDRIFTYSYYKTAKQPGRPPRDTPDNLHSAGEDGNRYGDQGHQFDHSLYNKALRNPGTTLGVIAAAGVAALGLLSRPASHLRSHRG